MTEDGTQFKRGIHADLDFRIWLGQPRVLLYIYRKDRIKNNFQKYALILFDNGLV